METRLGKVFVLIILFLIGAPLVSVLDKKRSRKIYGILLVGACAAVCCITLISRYGYGDRTAQLVPFYTYTEALNALPLNIAPYLKDGKLILRERLLAFSYSFQHIGLNVLLFVPFGYLLKILFGNKKGTWIILRGMFFSLLIECIQYTFCLGWFDIDDIINNTLGTCIGCLWCMVTNWLLVKVKALPIRKDQRNRDRRI